VKRTLRRGRAGPVLVIAVMAVILASCGERATVDTARPVVIFVPGIWDTGGKFDRMAEALGNAGWQTYEVALAPNDGSVSLSRLAKDLRKFINGKLGWVRRFDIVAFSMGGLVARSYVQRLGGLARVDHFVTISTPHHGTVTADLGNLPGFLDMQPQSAFLTDLNKGVGRLSKLSFTSIWTPLDLIVVPADSSRLPVGAEVKLGVLTHNWMVTDRRVIDAVLAALAAKK